ncbi:MAG: carboxypeptidase-like regulatory domain-containing protein [Marinirhabdus sp.]|nr:carboxypeptidase-like regulatory domain-containing protein [Marinirhabdus sp.]
MKNEREKLLVQRTIQSLIKYGAFLLVIMAIVFACSNKAEEKENIIAENNETANFTAKADGALMGSVIAPNATIEITARNGEDKIVGTTDANGEFFITGFDAGTYTVTIATENTDEEETFQDVEIQIGEVTALGTIDLEE